jgi:hypothetical protein
VDGAVDEDFCGAGEDTVSKDSVDEADEDCEPTPRSPRTPRTPRTPPTPRTPLAPIDHVAPAATLSVPKGLRLRGLRARGLALGVRSSEAGTVTAVLSLESKPRRVLARAKLATVAGRQSTLKLRFGSRARRLLAGRSAARLKLVVTFTDRAGNARTLTRRLRLPH